MDGQKYGEFIDKSTPMLPHNVGLKHDCKLSLHVCLVSTYLTHFMDWYTDAIILFLRLGENQVHRKGNESFEITEKCNINWTWRVILQSVYSKNFCNYGNCPSLSLRWHFGSHIFEDPWFLSWKGSNVPWFQLR